ncbi:hypothetical protein F2P45_01085 [Massilia sp. CCM 8733]|uniref:Uncharacterized protein n=1 Tax=Massilia mucilaginosa TaxID=2609282 RepID=A0ABX0NLE2_9BURK|nr:hypothetical protein [Massilia mucilaginosa]NHZ87634.1 hypothetical protein [Massilia mucilaginosa]
MYTFILIVEDRARPDDAGCFLRPLTRHPIAEHDGRFCIVGERGAEDGWMAITRQDAIRADFDDEELRAISDQLDTPAFYLVESRDRKTNFATGFIEHLDDSLPALIDNNHWFIGDVATMKGLINAGVDWRYYSPPASMNDPDRVPQQPCLPIAICLHYDERNDQCRPTTTHCA